MHVFFTFSHLEGQGKESMYIQKYSQCFSNIRIFVTVNIELCRGKHIQQAHCLTPIPVLFFYPHWLSGHCHRNNFSVAIFDVASPKSPSLTATVTRLGNTCQLADITCVKDSYRPGYNVWMLKYTLQATAHNVWLILKKEESMPQIANLRVAKWTCRVHLVLCLSNNVASLCICCNCHCICSVGEARHKLRSFYLLLLLLFFFHKALFKPILGRVMRSSDA